MSNILKKVIIECLKQTNTSFADFATDDEMTEELTQIDIDVETQKIHVKFQNNWIEEGYETVILTPIELIGFMCLKMEEKGII